MVVNDELSGWFFHMARCIFVFHLTGVEVEAADLKAYFYLSDRSSSSATDGNMHLNLTDAFTVHRLWSLFICLFVLFISAKLLVKKKKKKAVHTDLPLSRLCCP